MIRLPNDFKEFFELLNSEKVDYLLVGGYAVIYHGYTRATGDIDVWVAVSPTNAERISNARVQFGFSEDAIRPVRFLELDRVFQMGVPLLRIDLLTGIAGV